MGAANVSKIERVTCPRSPGVWVDLYLDKKRGMFFATVGKDRVEDPTKAGAFKKVEAALTALSTFVWEPVIVISIRRGDDDDDGDDGTRSTHNGMPNFGASCAFSYCRRERAVNPLKPKERLERAHVLDFEEIIAGERAGCFGRSAAERRDRAAHREQEMRQARAANQNVHTVFLWGNVREHELPYSDAAWAGVQRIAQTLRDTQRKLDEFAGTATIEKLAQLAGGDVFALLPASAPKKKKEAP